MREIKYRGKRIDNGKWVYGCYLYGSKLNDSKFYYIVEREERGCSYGINPETVGEYTGLHDCKDVELYEGDIINYVEVYRPGSIVNGIETKTITIKRFPNMKSGVVIYGVYNCSCCDGVYGYGCKNGGDLRQDFEIIGNIHD